MSNRGTEATAGSDTPARLGVRGWSLVVTLCGATFLTGVDFSIVAVALPAIGLELGFASADQLQWVVTAFLLPTASLLPLAGRLSDLVGRWRLFTGGVLVLGALSLLAGLATDPVTLVAARAGQGVAAAMIAPTAIALLTDAFAEGPERNRALGVNGVLLSLGFVLGTIGGGLITSGLSWRWTMLLLAIGSGLLLLGALTVVPRRSPRTHTRLDVAGAVLATLGLFALVYGISGGSASGWTSLGTLGSLLAAVLLLGLFGYVQASSPNPLIPPDVLRRPTIRYGVLVGVLTFGFTGGTTVTLSLYLQDLLGLSALATGFAFLGEGLAAILAGYVASGLVGSLGAVPAIAAGLVVQATGTGMLVVLGLDGPLALPLAVAGSSVLGFGHVLAVVSFVAMMTSGTSEAERGTVGSLTQLPTYLGAIGTAAMTAVLTARSRAVADAIGAVRAELSGVRAAMLVATIVTLAGALLAITHIRRLVARPPAAPD